MYVVQNMTPIKNEGQGSIYYKLVQNIYFFFVSYYLSLCRLIFISFKIVLFGYQKYKIDRNWLVAT